uniref:Reverse transcriptase domain-containing protein n=1 Tax=Tanacetum cinerariifolium TaxID=118510 RepID=A0A699HTJ4_TANCI|nr:reverse transcriptase domain-containing protein [Tanacetum cinerariifolium]
MSDEYNAPLKRIFKFFENRYIYKGRVVNQSFDDLVYVRSMFSHIEFDCLLGINEQIIPHFILEFYSQYRINYDLQGQIFVEFLIQNQLFYLSLEEFGQILSIPYKGDYSFSDRELVDIVKSQVGYPGSGVRRRRALRNDLVTNERNELVPIRTVIYWCVCIDYYHSTLKYLLAKQDAKPRLIRWILLLQEFDIEIKNKKGAENVMADYLSRLENPNLEDLRDEDIDDNFPDETLMNISSHDEEEIIRGSFIINGHRVKLYHDEEQLNELLSEEIYLICKKGKMRVIPFMAPFLKDYRKAMPWVTDKPFIYNVVENTCNEAKLYDLDKTGKGIVKGNILYVKEDSSEEFPLNEK